MTRSASNTQNWLARLNGAGWLALTLFALAGWLVVGQLPVWMIALVILAGLILGAILFLPRWLAKRGDPAYSPRASLAAFALAGALGAIGLSALPLYYLAFWVQTGPTAVPLATLSNGQKTVVFQGMQHVASEEFYKSVVFDLENALTEGYTLFYEGVQPVPDRPDLTDWFKKTMLGTDKDLSAGYVALADECGLKFQLNYFKPLVADAAIHPERHVTADVNYSDMKAAYERLVAQDPAFAAAMAAKLAKPAEQDADDPIAPLLGSLTNATAGQKNLIGIVCRGVLGMAVSGKLGKPNDPTNRIILDFRNQALARFVAESTATKIYITYGAAHFPGFFAELQKRDPNFAIRSVKGVRPMSLPDDVNLARSAVLRPGK